MIICGQREKEKCLQKGKPYVDRKEQNGEEIEAWQVRGKGEGGKIEKKKQIKLNENPT